MKTKFFTIVTFLLVFLTGQTFALTITDVETWDNNIITSQSSTFIIGGGVMEVHEDYGEQYLIPYPSHDGNAVVNLEGNFFDKIITKDLGDTGIWDLIFVVTNTGPFTWSDYHFEYWEPTFILPLGDAVDGFGNPILIGNPLLDWGNDIFTNSGIDPTIPSLNFWAPDWQYPGQTNTFWMRVDLDMLPDSFGVRQVATSTIPLPGAVWLFGSGLAGLIGLRRRGRR